MGKPIGYMVSFFFHKVKIIHTTRGRDKQNKKLHSSLVIWPRLVGIWTSGDGWKSNGFLTTPHYLVEIWSSTWFSVWLRRRTSGKAISRQTIVSIGLKCGTLLTLARKPHSCGAFGTRQLWSMSGGHVVARCPYPNNVFFRLPNMSKSVKISLGLHSSLGSL